MHQVDASVSVVSGSQRSSGSAQAAYQFGWVEAERIRELQDREQTDPVLCMLPALDLSDVGPVEVCLLGKSLLAETKRLTLGAHPYAELA